MAKRSKKKQGQKVSSEGKINSFLSRLGIKKSSGQYKESVYDLLDKEGVDHETIIKESDAFSAVRHNLYFSNKETAVRTLTLDYKRYVNVIKTLDSLNGFPEHPDKICDIGSGPGVISLWLAQKYPESQITALDHSENALAIGQSWADKMDIKNVHFEIASYGDIFPDNTDKYDFIFGTAFLDLKLPTPNGFTHAASLRDLKLPSLNATETKPIKTFMEACKNLVSESGLIYLDIRSQNEFGLLALLEYAKENNLGIDWNCSTVLKKAKQCQSYELESVNLFLRPGLSTFIDDPWEEWLSLMLIADMDGKPITLTPIKFETYYNLLSKGLKILDVELLLEQSKETLSIYISSGLVGFFRFSEKFGNSGMVYSAGAIYDILGQFNGIISQAQDINFRYLHQLLENE